jgi:hypothetical protein
MSFYSFEIDALDDRQLAKYVDDVEISVGIIPGLAEELRKKNPKVTGYTSLFWEIQHAGLNKWLHEKGVQGNAMLNLNASFADIRQVLNSGPVVIGTNKMGNLPGGHVILGVGKDDLSIICLDPFGDARNNYTDGTGDSVYYYDEFLKKYFTGRILYWRS